MKKIILSTVACATMMLAANADYKYEITPTVGGVDSFIDQVELGFLRSIEDVKYEGNGDSGITRIFTNLVKEYGLTSDISLYTLVGAGVEIFDNEANGNEDGVFGQYGAGVKYKIADQFALKFDVRHLVEADHGDNNLLYNLGFAIPFGEVSKPAPVVAAAPVVAKPAPVVQAPKDTDGDGVLDSLDQCPNTMKGAKVDTVGCMTLVNLNINFDHDKSIIKDSYNSRIAEFATVMKSNPKLKATIAAHTDSDGTDAYNQKLSERRAAATVEALKGLGVNANSIKAVGYGETKPVATNATAEGKAQNRRVEAVMAK